MSYPANPIVVDIALTQRVEVLDPCGCRPRIYEDDWQGLSQGMVESYAGGWLTTMLENAPSNALVRISQDAMLTSEQLPRLRHSPDFGPAEWLPLDEAIARGLDNLGKLDRMPMWGGGGI